ncbi:MAG TPA: DUF6624 domain-containing protein [Vitreimonas sp.]|jgi:hypothetical protein|nr:DUF6624 domain-containing protein [Vitreimonas sp.]
MTDDIWRDKLIAAVQRDYETRARLVREGTLYDGYNAEMEAVHLENARVLDDAIAAMGWPGRSKIGDEGAAAAFKILQHAISRPDLQRRGLDLILEAIPRGDANPLDAAYLSDRIAMYEGRPQVFGTQFDWDANGQLSPAPIKDPQSVDERRAALGLPPMADTIAEVRANAAAEGGAPPADLAQRRAQFEAWTRRVGWRA